MDFKPVMDLIVKQAAKDIADIQNAIKWLEQDATIEPKRAARRQEQYLQACEYDGRCPDRDTSKPNEFDPLDWIPATNEQKLGEIAAKKNKILDILSAPVRFCFECEVLFEPSWTRCPGCGNLPQMPALHRFIRNACVRCDRFPKFHFPEHEPDTVFCPYHGLKLKLSYHGEKIFPMPEAT